MGKKLQLRDGNYGYYLTFFLLYPHGAKWYNLGVLLKNKGVFYK